MNGLILLRIVGQCRRIYPRPYFDIGDRAIIGAGSVVTRDIGPDEIWAGNPAQCVKKAVSRPISPRVV